MIALAVLLAAADVTTPFPGATHVHHHEDGQDWHLLSVNLCEPGISLRTTASSEKGRVVSSFADLVGAAAAVNGDFFGSGFNTDGPSAHDGEVWGGADHTYVAPIAIGDHFVDVPHHNNELGLPAGTREVVSGHPTLLDDGNLVGNPGDPLCTNRHPRTALGISQDRRTLLLLVVDGRRTGAAGMTCEETASTLAFFGAFDAVNLDGGGSSTMWIGGSVKNRPSDGQQRTVANHLAVIAAGAGPSPQCPTRPYAAEFVSQSFPLAHVEPLVVEEGEEVEGFIEMRNTGSETWTSIVRLAPTPRDVDSPIAAPTWMAPHRVGSADADVASGAVGRFTFRVRGNAIGSFDQTFNLVAEGITWFDQPGDSLLRIVVDVVPAPPAPEPEPEPTPSEPVDDDGLPAPRDLPSSVEAGGCMATSGAPLAFVVIPLVAKRVRRGKRVRTLKGSGGVNASGSRR